MHALGNLYFLCLFRFLFPVVCPLVQSCGLDTRQLPSSAILNESTEPPRITMSSFHMASQSEGPALQPEVFFPGQEDAESKSRSHVHIPPGSPPSRNFLSTSPSPALRKSSTPRANTWFSFPSPHCLWSGVSSRLVRRVPGSKELDVITLGQKEEVGFITEKGFFQETP